MALSPTGEISGSPTTPGTSTFEVQVTDSATPTPGSATSTLSIMVGTNGPSAQLAATTASGTAPLDTAFELTATQLDSDSLTYSLDFGDGSQPSEGTLDAPYAPITISHTYAAPGTHTAEVTITDSVTGLSSTATSSVLVAR